MLARHMNRLGRLCSPRKGRFSFTSHLVGRGGGRVEWSTVLDLPIRVTMLLCDSAQLIDGKLYVLGGGWELFGPDPQPFALAGRIDLPVVELGKLHKWELYLEDADGQSVLPKEATPISQEFRLERTDATTIGEYVGVPFVVAFGPLALQPGARFVWRLYVDGRTDDTWFASFGVRQRVEPETAEQTN